MKEIAFFEKSLPVTPVVPLSGDYGDNHFYMKRDDMLPFSFGGNKVRKAAEFYREIKNSDTDVVMTYGSNSSNHCRIVSNLAAAGRCVSADREAFATLRVQATCMAMGESAGLLAALANKHGCAMGKVPAQELKAAIAERHVVL